ncbi:MAG TPA: alanine racemase [Bryobacterales bacterium]|jgi:D-serine deaminase-like pyridoxal phosphate-dependent protein|nr:alanine racemase [Bryobacterales bacterium]
MHISELETPALLIDLDRMEANLCRVAQYAKQHSLRLRPHTKTHKTPAIGRKQIELGAAGLTVAKVGEAEVMLSSGTPDLLVAYPVIGESKLRRLMQVARQTKLTVALDSVEAARELSDAAKSAGVNVAVLVEADVGMHRVGVAVGEDLVALAREVTRLSNLTLEGVACYPGHIRSAKEENKPLLERLARDIERIVQDFRRAGLPLKIVSAGSTPLVFQSHQFPGINEIRPGTYVFNDINCVRSGMATLEDCAVTILTTVVSNARPGYVIVDGGSKTFSSDHLAGSNEASFGYVIEAPQALFYNMNEEHGFLDVRECGRPFRIGERLRVIPNHVCVAMNLHEQVYGIRGDQVEQVFRVEGRGKLQ